MIKIISTFIVVILASALASGCSAMDEPVTSGSRPDAAPRVPSPIVPVGCSTGSLAVGEEGTEYFEGTDVPISVIGRECFDLFVKPDVSRDASADQRYTVEEFCEKLGIETELNALMGHGNMATGHGNIPGYFAYTDDDFNGGVSALLAGTCSFQIPLEELRSPQNEGDPSRNAIDISWISTGHSFVGEPPFEVFQRDVSGLPFTDLEGVGEYAVRVDKSESVIAFAAISPSDDGERQRIFAEILIDFSPSRADIASGLGDLAPGLLSTVLDRGGELLNGYIDYSAYSLYTQYPEYG
ncbi:hypothetical protein FB472_1177 [Rhodoglobus vestalii]|uniref:Uncharacterized protein n=1 Tax=Rhodoglobus vestalii TaxID=193384 RepID=A0A8H2K5L8_9MICO|nr:hypothetical protein [Rhodoglobus vestalii]TQO19610.1 hypothetical protein FB472_1177 [Rhodoglobus vestalii]